MSEKTSISEKNKTFLSEFVKAFDRLSLLYSIESFQQVTRHRMKKLLSSTEKWFRELDCFAM